MITQLEWQQPLWLLLALQPLLMHGLLFIRRRKLLNYAEPHLLPWAVRGAEMAKPKRGAAIANMVFWLLLALAAAGPRIPAGNLSADPTLSAKLRQDVGVMVVLNISASMAEGVSGVTPLARAKLELQDLVKRLRGDRIGLIIFSGDAGLVLPPSSDYRIFEYYLKLSGPQLLETSGTDLGKALSLAQKTLSEQKFKSSAVLLLTDHHPSGLEGELGAQALQAAQRLPQHKIPLYILGLGGVDASNRLSELATLGGGRYAAVRDGERDWVSLYDQGIGKLASDSRPPPSAQNWLPLFRWFLFPALLILLTRLAPREYTRVPLGVTALLALAMLPPSASAAENQLHAAYAALQSKQYARAQVLYATLPGFAARMGEGAAAYRRQDFVYAGRQFSAALLQAADNHQRADALFNVANSAFMASNFRVAADAYLGVLRYRPNDTRARNNLAVTAGKLGLQRKVGKPTQGIPGRRGLQAGGRLNEDISDLPVTMEADKNDDKLMAKILSDANRRVAAGDALAAAMGATDISATRIDFGTNVAFRAASKKLEYIEDKPDALLKSLMKHETQEAGK